MHAPYRKTLFHSEPIMPLPQMIAHMERLSFLQQLLVAVKMLDLTSKETTRCSCHT